LFSITPYVIQSLLQGIAALVVPSVAFAHLCSICIRSRVF